VNVGSTGLLAVVSILGCGVGRIELLAGAWQPAKASPIRTASGNIFRRMGTILLFFHVFGSRDLRDGI
jgi:hypothetical protein